MKQVITLLFIITVATSAFASGKPFKALVKISSASTETSINSLQIISTEVGKINLSWVAVAETTTTAYRIEKSTDGGATYKTSALLMGETNKSYSFCDKIKNFTGKIEYRVTAVDNGVVISTLTQNFIVL